MREADAIIICVPTPLYSAAIDPFYLTWKARQYGVDTRGRYPVAKGNIAKA